MNACKIERRDFHVCMKKLGHTGYCFHTPLLYQMNNLIPKPKQKILMFCEITKNRCYRLVVISRMKIN